MKILFFSHYFYPEGNAPATRVHQLTKHWAEAGHKVTVITCAPNVPNGVVYEGYRNPRPRQVETVDGVRVVRVWTYIAANKGTVRRIANYVSYMLSAVFFSLFETRPDIIIATSPQFFCGWAGAIVSRFRRRPFVLEVRDLWPESIKAVGALRPGPLLTLLEWLEKRLYRSARHIVTVGPGYKRGLVARGVPATKIDVIPNGINSEDFVPRAPDPRIVARHALEGKFVCSYIGTIGMACGLDVVLRAATKLKNEGDGSIVFLLVGDGASRKGLEDEARDLSLDNVVFAGRRPKSEMTAYLASTDVALVHLKKLPLFTDVLPSKMFEAMAMERPVLLGVQGDAAEVLEAAQAGLTFEPENETELLEALLRLTNSRLEREQVGACGRRHALSHYDRRGQATRYLSVLSALSSAAQQPHLSKQHEGEAN